MLSLFALVAALASPPVDGVVSWLRAHGWGAPVRDALLDEVAADLAKRLDGPASGPTPDAARAHLVFLLSRAGVADAHVYPLVVRHGDDAGFEAHLPALLGRLERSTPPTHVGVATVGDGGQRTTAVVLVHRGVVLDTPLPRAAPEGFTVHVAGALRRGYYSPRVILATPAGTREVAARALTRRVDAALALDAGPGVYGLEVVADSVYGPVVLANDRIYVGVDPPPLPVVRLAPAGPAAGRTVSPERALAALIDRHRAKAGLPPLRWDAELALVAHEHAQDLARRQTLVHAPPGKGTLVTRLRARGRSAAWVAENLAEADNPRRALEAFLASPGHARNLSLASLRDVGVGVSGRYYVVVLATR